MLAVIEITPWHWAGFVAFVLLFLAVDLGLFHRQAHEVKFKEAMGWTILWVTIAMLFAGAMVPLQGKEKAVAFLTGYFVELSLSMDNVFVIAVIFGYFKVPGKYQHRVLFWGIIGALVMRGVMILIGVGLINRFQWVLYLLALLLFFAGFKLLFSKEMGNPENSRILKLAREFLAISPELDGQKFITHVNGKRMLTPLFLVLLMVETTDLLFAVDSIPAIFGVTRDPFVVFTSNVFAILGLRSMYFLLAGAIGLFRYLNVGLAVVLMFIGVKMLLDPHDDPPKWFQVDISNSLSLGVVLGLIGLSILISVMAARRDRLAGDAADGRGKLE
jgi:tellurite resistance protein TerC